MSIKSINEISKIYVDQIIESTNYETDMNEAIGGLRSREERMARMITPAQRKQQERVRKGRAVLADIQATEKALKAPKSSPEKKPEYNTPEAEVRVLKPGQKKDTVALKAKKIIGEAKKEKPKRWWDDDGDGKGYEEGEVSGSFKRKKKKVKNESYSNWREDLSEVVEVINKDKNGEKIVEKAVDNTKLITINPTVSEAVESLGGTLIEMEEYEDFEGILDDLSESDIFLLSDRLIEEAVEEMFYECIEEGYDVEEIENVIIESLEISTFLLTEEEDVKSSKLDKVKSAVKKVARGVGYAAGAAVRGARAIGREVRSGYASGRSGSSSASGGSSSASGSSSRRSSGGSEKVVKKGPGLLSRIGSSLKRGLKRVVAKGARKVARGASKLADRMERGKVVTPDDKTPSPAHSRSGPLPAKRPPSGAGQKEKVGTGPTSSQPKKKPAEKPADPWEGSATTPSKPKPKKPAEKPADPWEGTATTPKRVVKAKPKPKAPKATTKTTTVTSTPSEKPKRSRKNKEENPQKKGAPSLDDLLKSEEVQLIEKTLTAAEKRKREEIAKSMNLSDFEGRYPGRGMEVKMATATKMAKRIAEQSMTKSQEQSETKPEKPLDTTSAKQKFTGLKTMMQKQQQLEKQKLNLKKQGKLPLEDH